MPSYCFCRVGTQLCVFVGFVKATHTDHRIGGPSFVALHYGGRHQIWWIKHTSPFPDVDFHSPSPTIESQNPKPISLLSMYNWVPDTLFISFLQNCHSPWFNLCSWGMREGLRNQVNLMRIITVCHTFLTSQEIIVLIDQGKHLLEGTIDNFWHWKFSVAALLSLILAQWRIN